MAFSINVLKIQLKTEKIYKKFKEIKTFNDTIWEKSFVLSTMKK